MKKCDVCNTTIVFGPVRQDDRIYCSYECRSNDSFKRYVEMVPDEQAEEYARKLNAGRCPQCSGTGPIDVMHSYTAISALVLTVSSDNPELSCGVCARKARLKATALTFAFGWWGFPMGIIMTPIQIIRNIRSSSDSPRPGEPSTALCLVAKKLLADEIYIRASAIKTETTDAPNKESAITS